MVGDYFILTVFPNIPWEILLKIEYLTFILPVVLFSLFLHRLFPFEINRTALRIYLGISALLALFVIITAVRIFSWIIIPFQVLLISWCSYLLVVLILAVKRKRRGSIFLLLGGMALFLSGLNDILYNNLLLNTGMLFPLGMFVFILFQALVMAQRSSTAYFQVEELSTNLERQVKQRTGELLHKNNQLKQLLHILCHDLQNPLANIRSIIDLSLADPRLFTEMAPYAATAVENGLAIIELIRGIRVLEDKPLTLSLESLNLMEMVTASEQLLSQQITRKKITIEKKIDSDIRVKVERTSFVNSVLNNILTNAIKYSFEGGLIRIEASRENGHIVLSIIDTGIGMPQTLLEDLFNLEKSTSRNGTAGETGTGFGMPLVRTLVTAYGGVVDAISREERESASGHGTEVRLVLQSA
ncbi:MAG: sensor histidine kinase [bacterium]